MAATSARSLVLCIGLLAAVSIGAQETTSSAVGGTPSAQAPGFEQRLAAASEPARGRPSRKLDVWYVPTPHEIVQEMMDVAKVRAGDVVYDLGCGDGRMVIAAAKKYGTRGVGVDLDPARIREARANARREGVEHLVTFEVGDLFETDIKEATVVMLYLLPELNRRLKPRLFEQLRPGARVVSHDFDMGRDWPADEYIKLGGDGIYLWVMPPYEQRPSNTQ
jgi:SAM-dependent methyltransferase